MPTNQSSESSENVTLQFFAGGQDRELWQKCSSIRWSVFVKEQEVPAVLEIDARDFLPSTIHLILLGEEGGGIATARLLEDRPGKYHLGRVAVLKNRRGEGWGRKIVDSAMAAVREVMREQALVSGQIVLDAQVQAIGFYERVGYRLTQRPQFLDAGIAHREMQCQLSS